MAYHYQASSNERAVWWVVIIAFWPGVHRRPGSECGIRVNVVVHTNLVVDETRSTVQCARDVGSKPDVGEEDIGGGPDQSTVVVRIPPMTGVGRPRRQAPDTWLNCWRPRRATRSMTCRRRCTRTRTYGQGITERCDACLLFIVNPAVLQLAVEKLYRAVELFVSPARRIVMAPVSPPQSP